MKWRIFWESSSDEIKNCQLLPFGSFQAYRGSYVLAFHQARHAHPTQNLESRARAPRAGAGGTPGRHRGWCLLLRVTPPSRNRKEQLSWRTGYLAMYRGCCYEEKELGDRYEEVEDWASTGGRWWEVYWCWGRDVNIFKCYWLWICLECKFWIYHIVHLGLLNNRKFLKGSRSSPSRW